MKKTKGYTVTSVFLDKPTPIANREMFISSIVRMIMPVLDSGFISNNSASNSTSQTESEFSVTKEELRQGSKKEQYCNTVDF